MSRQEQLTITNNNSTPFAYGQRRSTEQTVSYEVLDLTGKTPTRGRQRTPLQCVAPPAPRVNRRPSPSPSPMKRLHTAVESSTSRKVQTTSPSPRPGTSLDEAFISSPQSTPTSAARPMRPVKPRNSSSKSSVPSWRKFPLLR